MRKIIFCLALAIIVAHGTVLSQEKGFGVGFVTGQPTGISTKIWTGPANALQFSLAWRNENGWFGNRVSLSGDYLWHSFDAIRSEYRFPVYYGVGGMLTTGGDERDNLGIRGVVGIGFLPRTVPIDVFMQIVPVFVISPDTHIDVDAGLGLRFFFK